MKKFRSFIVLMVLCCLLLVALTACNGNDKGETGSGNDAGSGNNVSSGNESGSSDVSEIERLRHIMSVVLNEFSSMTRTATAKLSADIESVEQFDLEKPSAVQDIFDYMDTVEDKESIGTNISIDNVAMRGFIGVQAFGELLNEVCDTDEIFDLPIEIEMGENTLPSKFYIVIKSEGTHITAYLYGNDDEVGEIVYQYDIDYISDDEFSAKMITMSKDKLDYYFYGDTDGNALWLVNSQGIEYKDQNADVAYQSENASVLHSCVNVVESEVDGIDFALIRSLKDSCEYSATELRLNEISDKLFEQYGIQ